MKKVGAKVLGLPEDKKDWIKVALVAASRRLASPNVRRLSNGVSVDYTANIPADAVDTVDIVTDAAELKGFVDAAVTAADVTGVTVDAAAFVDLTSTLEEKWTSAVESATATDPPQTNTTQETVVNPPTPRTTTPKAESPWQPINFASGRSHLCTWAVLIMQCVVAWFAVVPSL